VNRTDELIQLLDLQPHPEGGHYTQTYKSELIVQTERGARAASTSIYFLLSEGSKSHLHRLQSDEGWHFHEGAPVRIVEITTKGMYKETIIGSNFKAGQLLQYYVPAGSWFGSESLGEYSLVGCTVSPGFEFEDFELLSKKALPRYIEPTDRLLSFCIE
jgi:predicted cupin superfamily sugar epimerase